MGGELPAREVARDLHLPVLGIPTSLVARHRQKSQRSSQDIRAWDKFSGKYLPHKSRFRPGNPRLGRFHRISNRDSGNGRSEEHTSELQSLMRISYAVFCLKKKKNTDYNRNATYVKSY